MLLDCFQYLKFIIVKKKRGGGGSRKNLVKVPQSERKTIAVRVECCISVVNSWPLTNVYFHYKVISYTVFKILAPRVTIKYFVMTK